MKRVATLGIIALLISGCRFFTGPNYDCTHERRRTFPVPVTVFELDSAGVVHVTHILQNVTWIDTICVDR